MPLTPASTSSPVKRSSSSSSRLSVKGCAKTGTTPASSISSMAHQHRGEVRPPDLRARTAGLVLDFLECDGYPELVEALDYEDVPIRSVVLQIGERLR